MTQDYIITTEEGEHHQLKISWAGNRSLVYISTNFRTIGLSPSMATEVMHGLMAILKGEFERAISETALRLEQEDARYREATHYSPPTPRSGPRPEPHSPPTIDQL